MIYGDKKDYDQFVEKYKDQPHRIEKINKGINWLPNGRWYITQQGDSDVEKRILYLLMTSPEVPRIRMLATEKVEQRQAMTVGGKPPAKKPPNIFGKVASFWHATTGPTTTETEFQRRLSKCTKEGGYTFAPISGKITLIDYGNRIIAIDEFEVGYPEDETPTVLVNQPVNAGEIITAGTVAKPCQYLVTQPDGKIHCGACGCGARTQAELHTKLHYVNITCPRTPPLFTKEQAENDLGSSTSGT